MEELSLELCVIQEEVKDTLMIKNNVFATMAKVSYFNKVKR